VLDGVLTHSIVRMGNWKKEDGDVRNGQWLEEDRSWQNYAENGEIQAFFHVDSCKVP
jgi:hypothetical protein